MHKAQLKLADRLIAIDTIYLTTQFQCRDYLVEPDELDEQEQPDITLVTTENDIALERQEAQFESGVSSHERGYLETLAVYRQIANAMPAYDTFLMHGAVVSDGARAFMFTAPSGVGKTTRIRMFLDQVPGSFVINGDKPLLRVEQGSTPTVTVYGTPWAGKEQLNTNTSAPLQAIFLLERAGDGEPSTITPVSPAAAYGRLHRQTYLPPDEEAAEKVAELLATVAASVRIYRFRSSLDPADIRKAYEIAADIRAI